ncbi:MAG: putative baseplate assembly protein [Nitrospiraceae bacterium]
MKPKQTESVPPSQGLKTLYLKGTSTNLKVGDAVLIIGDERAADPGNENWDFRRLTSVTPVIPAGSVDPDKTYTIISLDQGLGSFIPLVEPTTKNPRIFALRRRASLFGYNAPDWRAMPNSLKASYLGFDPAAPNLNDLLKPYTNWPDFTIAAVSDPPPRSALGTGLYGEYFNTIDFKDRKATRTDTTINFDFGAGSPIAGVGSDNFSIRWTGWVQPKASGPYSFHALSDDGVRLWVDGKLIIDQWHDQGATENTSMSAVTMTAGRKYDIKLEYYEHTGLAVIKLSWSAPGLAKEIIPSNHLYPRDIHDVHLDAIYSQILAGSWVVLSIPEYQEAYRVKESAEDARSNFTLSAKTTRLTLQGEQLRELFNERIRDTIVFSQSEELEWGERPIPEPVTGTEVLLNSEVGGLAPDQLVAIAGKDSATEEHVAEIATIDRVEQQGKLTRLVLKSALEHSYDRTSAVINANVARATHGDTKEEILGSGDGSKPFQTFQLKQKPLTFVSAATASGAETTLEVRVDDILWHEKPDFFQLPSTERTYVTRIADGGKVTVQFGDGRTGARVPTGTENVSARYRVGIGMSGMLAADQINQLMSRPLGLRSVTNPRAPTGAEDPEQPDQARQNAPLTVVTLDRIVSLQDFEDFARAFAGIGKAQATWLWDGEKRLVHVTIAGVEGGDVPRTSDPFNNLSSAIDNSRHADQRVRIDPYTPLLFDVEAKLLIAPDYLFADVKGAVEKALVEAFSFDHRSFGQAITASEVIGVAQGVDGVVAIDLDRLYFDGSSATSNQRLPANIAHWEANQLKPAELLTINASGIKLMEMTE